MIFHIHITDRIAGSVFFVLFLLLLVLVQISRASTIESAAALDSVSAFRNISCVAKVPSVDTGTTAAVILNRYRLHLNSEVLRLRWNQGNSTGEHPYWRLPTRNGEEGGGVTNAMFMQEMR